MAGTFAAWRLGTLQARVLPLARELRSHGVRCAIVTVPWDLPTEAGVTDSFSTVAIHNTASAGVVSFPLAVAQQVRQIRSLQPRAVHVFKPKGYGGLSARLLSSTMPILVDSDDWEGDGGWNQAGNYSFAQRRLFHWQERSLLRSALAVTSASHLLVHRARTLRDAPHDSVSWVPNGLETGWAHALSTARHEAVTIEGNVPRIVLYSRFAEFPEAWLSRFLKTLSDVVPLGMSVTVSVLGDSPEFVFDSDTVKMNRMGYVARSVVPTVLGRSDIAIFPYTDALITRSKNSVKLLELMAAGCCIVASGVGDVPAVAADAAVLLDGADPDAFASATAELLRNRDRIQRLSTTAQRRALERFLLPAVADRLVNAYRNAGVLQPCSNA